MTENAVQLAIKHVLPRNSARPKSSALFYEKRTTYVSPSVSGIYIYFSEIKNIELRRNNLVASHPFFTYFLVICCCGMYYMAVCKMYLGLIYVSLFEN